jgi:catechol 2,3-dioxygenase-like lactoylglutathione lyase family enzyme
MLAPPRFHHLHLRSTDPDAAIGFYTRQFPTTSKGSWGEFPALMSPNDVMILFDKVDEPPTSQPQSAIWHFGWHVTDCRKSVATFDARPEVGMLPLYTGVEDGHVLLSSDTWFRDGPLLGVTRRQIDGFLAAGTPVPGGPGFAYFQGPDDALVEIAGDYGAERFNHVHMWQEEPLKAQLWYQEHFNVAPRASFGPVSAADANRPVPRGPDRTFPALKPEGMYRFPRGIGCLDREAARRGCPVPFRTLQSRRHTRRHDRGAEPGSAGTGGSRLSDRYINQAPAPIVRIASRM